MDRAHVVLSPKNSARIIHAVLWTNGPHFYEVFSTSLPDILYIEKRLSR